MPGWSARLLGSEELRVHQRIVSHLPDIWWPLFACLLTAPRSRLSRSRVAGLLWPERDETAARHCLATALWRIRARLPDDQNLLIVEEEAIGLRLANCWIDAAVLEHRAARIAIDPDLLRGRSERERLGRALATYRGSFMPERQIEWIAVERERLRTLFLDALYELGLAEMADGRFERARRAARRLCEVEPLREDAQRLLMTAHVRCGSRGVALAQYRSLQKLLQAELGIDPMPETRTLAERIAAGAEPAFALSQTLPPDSTFGAGAERSLLLEAREHLTQSLALLNKTLAT